MSLILRPVLAAFAFTALLAAPAMAETVNFKATMNGASEVPPNQSKGTGAVTATYDTATKKLTYKGNYSGLSGDATMAHFHGPAEAGKNAPVAVPIKDVKPSFEGTADLTEAQAADLMGGRWYVNVHTAANPGGEIRGQVTK
jgi:hypothetical protein